MSFYVLVAPWTPILPRWIKWGSNESVGFRRQSSQPLSYKGPHSLCGRCLRNMCYVLSCCISSGVFQRRTSSSMTRDCCVSPWTARCASVTCSLGHRTECLTNNFMGDQICGHKVAHLGDWEIVTARSGLLAQFKWILGKDGGRPGQVTNFSGGWSRALLLLMSATASLFLPWDSVLVCLNTCSPMPAHFHYILASSPRQTCLAVKMFSPFLKKRPLWG